MQQKNNFVKITLTTKNKPTTLYIPLDAFDDFRIIKKDCKVNNYSKEFFDRFILEGRDSITKEKFSLRGKCNKNIMELEENKIVNLENYIEKYKKYEVQK